MKQVIAMGGGGFEKDEKQVKFQQYVLGASGKTNPRVCLIPTAGADNYEGITNFYDNVLALGGTPSHLSLFRLPTADLEGFLLEKDILFVGGGNTRSMMALWREWDLFRILRNSYEAGVLCAGVSAGGNCWFEQGITNSVPGQMNALACVGIVPGSFCPHYDSQPERRPAYHDLMASGAALAGYGADEAAALHLVEGEPPRTLRFGTEANIYRVELVNGAAIESPLPDVVELTV